MDTMSENRRLKLGNWVETDYIEKTFYLDEAVNLKKIARSARVLHSIHHD